MKKSRKIKSFFLNALVWTAAAFICLLLAGMILCILARGLPNISLDFLTNKPSLLHHTVGILPNLLNTLYIILMTLLIVLPLGVGAAVYLSEYAKNKKAVRIIELAAETLSGIPSIIYGLVGMLIFVQFCSLQTSLLAGALTLVIMTLPTIIRTTQESLKTVPESYRKGAFGLGAGKWHAIRTVVLPSAIDGIVTGCILAVGRIVGESAALMYTAGMANEILTPKEALSAGGAGSTLTVTMYFYTKERVDIDTAFAIAAILLILTLLLNIAAKIAAKLLKKGKGK